MKPIRGLKPLRRPRLWLGLWCAAIVLVIVVCLLPLSGLPPLPANSDKLEHLLTYFVLATFAVQLFARPAPLRAAALGLLLLGLGIEVAQGMTTYRSADPWDMLANTLGVALGMATVVMPWRDWLWHADKSGP